MIAGPLAPRPDGLPIEETSIHSHSHIDCKAPVLVSIEQGPVGEAEVADAGHSDPSHLT